MFFFTTLLRLEFFESDATFRHMSKEEKSILSTACSVQNFAAGEVILREGWVIEITKRNADILMKHRPRKAFFFCPGEFQYISAKMFKAHGIIEIFIEISDRIDATL